MTAVPSGPKLRVSRLVELVGPAGAGKSTIFRALRTRAQNVDVPPVLLTREYAPTLVVNVAAILGTLIRRGAMRRAAREPLRSMVYLRALPGLVERRPLGEGNVLLFDQGPLYLLGRPKVMDARLAIWRQEMFESWASLLDVVVWLDAPDAVLVERIDGRSNWHRVKGQPVGHAIDVLAEARAVYEEMISRLADHRDGPTILQFDTSRTASEDVVDAVMAAVGGFSVPAGSATTPKHLSVRDGA